MLFNCRTTLVGTLRAQFPDPFADQASRAILLAPPGPVPEAELKVYLTTALTYHQRGRLAARATLFLKPVILGLVPRTHGSAAAFSSRRPRT